MGRLEAAWFPMFCLTTVRAHRVTPCPTDIAYTPILVQGPYTFCEPQEPSFIWHMISLVLNTRALLVANGVNLASITDLDVRA